MDRYTAKQLVDTISAHFWREWQRASIEWLGPGNYGVFVIDAATRQNYTVRTPAEFDALRRARQAAAR